MMLNNTWFPKEVDMTRDVSDYKQITDVEKAAYDKALSQLILWTLFKQTILWTT